MLNAPIPHHETGFHPGPDTTHTLMRLAAALAFCSALALTAPHGLALVTFAGLLNLCAVAASAVAFFLNEYPFAPHMTRWDEAGTLVLISLTINWFVDPVAVQAALEAARVLSN
ncbi:hypothetical protein CCP1ISM_8490002 [Azospirillaceae bacterium]